MGTGWSCLPQEPGSGNHLTKEQFSSSSCSSFNSNNTDKAYNTYNTSNGTEQTLKQAIRQDVHEIRKGLWLGNVKSSLDEEFIQCQNISLIVSVVTKQHMMSLPNPNLSSTTVSFERLLIPVNDTEETDILQHLAKCIDCIQSRLTQKQNVLVHCSAGVSRSPTVVASWLMFSENLNSQQALAEVEKRRKQINPIPGFRRQLEWFGKILAQVDPSLHNNNNHTSNHSIKSCSSFEEHFLSLKHEVESKDLIEIQLLPGWIDYLRWKESNLQNIRMKKLYESWSEYDKRIRNGENNSFHKDEFKQRIENSVDHSGLSSYYESRGAHHCRKCKMLLFREKNIISHPTLYLQEEEEREEEEKEGKGKKEDERKSRKKVCNCIIIDAQQWFTNENNVRLVKGEQEGELYCSCNNKEPIGEYKWCGRTCDCGCWFKPAFVVFAFQVTQSTLPPKNKGEKKN